MSEPVSTLPSSEESPFTPAQVRQFDQEDADAGAAIGKMLSLFFLYTVIVMTISTVVTYWWIHQIRTG